MTFGEFYAAVCVKLRSDYGWGAPGKFMETTPALMDVIHEQWELKNEVGDAAYLVHCEEAAC